MQTSDQSDQEDVQANFSEEEEMGMESELSQSSEERHGKHLKQKDQKEKIRHKSKSQRGKRKQQVDVSSKNKLTKNQNKEINQKNFSKFFDVPQNEQNFESTLESTFLRNKELLMNFDTFQKDFNQIKMKLSVKKPQNEMLQQQSENQLQQTTPALPQSECYLNIQTPQQEAQQQSQSQEIKNQELKNEIQDSKKIQKSSQPQTKLESNQSQQRQINQDNQKLKEELKSKQEEQKYQLKNVQSKRKSQIDQVNPSKRFKNEEDLNKKSKFSKEPINFLFLKENQQNSQSQQSQRREDKNLAFLEDQNANEDKEANIEIQKFEKQEEMAQQFLHQYLKTKSEQESKDQKQPMPKIKCAVKKINHQIQEK